MLTPYEPNDALCGWPGTRFAVPPASIDARQGLTEIGELLKKTDQPRMEEIIEVPWFKPPAKISVRQALTQAAMHSHYHRGQNATRLRELGGVPPMTDYIVWLKNGQPAAQWE